MNRFLSFALAACLVPAGCSPGSPDAAATASPVALVDLAAARSGTVATTQTVYGAVLQNADTQYTLSAPVEALVRSLAVSPGAAVGQGQPVVTLAPSPGTQANIARLRAEARNARKAYERALRLRQDGLASDADVDSARAAAQSAQASAEAVAVQTRGLVLRAPGPGYVQSIAAAPGQLVAAGTTIATLSRRGALRAGFGIDPALVPRLSRGPGMQLESLRKGPPITVPIAAVDPSADPQTRLASIYVRVPASLGIGAGQPLKGTVTLEQVGNAVTIPYAALLDDGGQPYVFVAIKGVAHRRDVSVGATNATIAAIEKGVAPGEQVVIRGGTALEDGMRVRTR